MQNFYKFIALLIVPLLCISTPQTAEASIVLASDDFSADDGAGGLLASGGTGFGGDFENQAMDGGAFDPDVSIANGQFVSSGGSQTFRLAS